MRHAGWSPDYQLRLFGATGALRSRPCRSTKLVILDGPAGYLDSRLIHHNYASWRQFWVKQCRYARIEAAAMASRGDRAKPRNFVLQPLREFRRRYWTLQGYREGLLGLGCERRPRRRQLVQYAELWRLNGRHERERERGRHGRRRQL
jgi:hypothetical protein